MLEDAFENENEDYKRLKETKKRIAERIIDLDKQKKETKKRKFQLEDQREQYERQIEEILLKRANGSTQSLEVMMEKHQQLDILKVENQRLKHNILIIKEEIDKLCARDIVSMNLQQLQQLSLATKEVYINVEKEIALVCYGTFMNIS